MNKKYWYGKLLFCSFSLVFALGISGYGQQPVDSSKGYSPNYASLLHYTAPEWYEDAKLGFWVHWGIYSVPAYSGDHAAEWYGRWMYSMVDIVSKRGVLMLSFGPKADGTFPENQKQLMFAIGDWLKINREAIYSTRPWTINADGLTIKKLKKPAYAYAYPVKIEFKKQIPEKK